ncbi:MAG TPA: ABC transporter permease [Chitinophagaceae bacterium]|nr:ABC transporter permease [Chitinophagaceae bacterium]
MIINFFKIAWRNLIKNKSFSFINISGLAIGMATAMLILLWIQHEVSYDNFHEKKDRLYQVWNRYTTDGKTGCWNNTPKPMASAISQDYPEVEGTARVNFLPPVKIASGDKQFYGRGRIVDSTFLKMFTFPAVKGNMVTALNDVSSIVLTEKLAKSIFGNDDPIGKILKLDNTDNFKVSAVVKTPPTNSQFEFEFLLPWAYMRVKGWDDEYWANNSIATYVLLKKNSSLASIEPKIKALRKKYDKEDPKIETFLYPISRWHLYGSFENGEESGGRIEIVRLFGIIAAFILLVACINFMNLSTARSEKRSKEVGIRKVVGAQKKSLVFQFLGESVLLAFIAGIFAFVVVELALPSFNKLVDKKLFIDFGSPPFWLAAFAFVVITGILAGSYPAIYLSSFRPVSVLKGSLKAANALVTPRKVLVISQFSFAIILIVATIIVRQQIQKAQDRQAGYAQDNLVYHFTEGESGKNHTLIKNELLASGTAVSVTMTSSPVTEGWSNTWGLQWPGKDLKDKTIINRFCADDAVVKTLGLQLVKGRDFDLKNFPTDSNAALLNESAVKHMGFKEPLGQVIKDMGQDWHVVGVVKDFIINSPYHPLEPMFIAGAKGWFEVMHIKLNGKNSTEKNIATLKTIFKKHNPEYDVNYRFADEQYARKFSDEKRTGTLATLFALLTIVISCLGLFGLSSYMAENRIKEIGVRKVLGATVNNITILLSKDFLKLVFIAFVIASPLAYWAMYKWLQPFPYRVTIHWWVFALAGLSAVFIALFTVSFQAIKAAIANPVKSLRTE